MKEKNKTFEQLKKLYLFVFVLGAVIIAPTHLFPSPTFMYARFPHYLETMGPFLGVSWPATFEIYHYGLYALAIIGILNVLGIIFYPKFKQTTLVSSLMGLFLMILIVLFFFFVFVNINVPTALTYGLYSVVLLIVDFLTFKALVIRQKVALRGWF